MGAAILYPRMWWFLAGRDTLRFLDGSWGGRFVRSCVDAVCGVGSRAPGAEATGGSSPGAAGVSRGQGGHGGQQQSRQDLLTSREVFSPTDLLSTPLLSGDNLADRSPANSEAGRRQRSVASSVSVSEVAVGNRDTSRVEQQRNTNSEFVLPTDYRAFYAVTKRCVYSIHDS